MQGLDRIIFDPAVMGGKQTSSSRAVSLSARKTVKRMKPKSSFEAARLMTAGPKRSSRSASRAFSTSSRSISSNGVCASCGRAGVHLRRVTRSFGRGTSLLVVEGIPMWSCPHCGESYFTAQTMHELQRIKALRKSVAVERRVSVAEFHAQGA